MNVYTRILEIARRSIPMRSGGCLKAKTAQYMPLLMMENLSDRTQEV